MISTDSTTAGQKKQEPAGRQSRNLQEKQTVRDEIYEKVNQVEKKQTVFVFN